MLGLNLTDSAKVDAAWDIISNTEAIAVNQQWAGQPGRLVQTTSSHQVWAKQLPHGDVAVLVFNRGADPIDIAINATVISPNLTEHTAARDIWKHVDAHGLISGGTAQHRLLSWAFRTHLPDALRPP